jgi:nucleotide-binding universal stress UspA family protein
MYDTILLPTDGSDHALRAAEHGLALARRYEATAHIVTVVDVQRAAGMFSAGGIDREFVDRLEAMGEEHLRTIEAITRESDDVRAEVVRGEPWKSPSAGVLQYADDHGIDMIAMGTHGRTGVRRALAGSVTERVVRLADVPVLTVGATDRATVDDYERILVPTDGSEHAAAAIDHALSIARTYDASVHTLFVVDIGQIATASDAGLAPQLIDDLEARGEKATAAIATQVREAGFDAVTEVREGFPAKAVLEYATDHDIDMIVMGTHGRTGLDRVLIGSTAARVLRRAELPVLTVKPDGERAEREKGEQ